MTSGDSVAQVTYDRLKETLEAMGAISMRSQPGGELARAVFDGKQFPTPPHALPWDPSNTGNQSKPLETLVAHCVCHECCHECFVTSAESECAMEA